MRSGSNLISFFFSASTLLLSGRPIVALVARANLPPTVASSSILGIATDAASPSIDRDGGGGGLLNGHSVWTYCDTMTTDSAGNMNSFASNTIAYSNLQNPLELTDFGLGSDGQVSLAIPFTANETEYNDSHDGSKQRYALWPGSNLTPIGDGSTGVIFPSVTLVDTSTAGIYTGAYNTLVTITAGDNGPTAVRTVEYLFFPNEVFYGSFSSLVGIDGYMYLFGSSSTGLRVARVPAGSVADRASYTYWDGSDWTATLPTSTDSEVVSAKLSSGDIFWSSYYNTFLMVYMNGYADSKFYLRYSVDGGVTNWSDEQLLFESPSDGSNFNYAGHVHPEFDDSGKTLVLTYTYSRSPYQTKVVKVTFG